MPTKIGRKQKPMSPASKKKKPASKKIPTVAVGGRGRKKQKNAYT